MNGTLRPLSPALAKKAAAELNENPSEVPYYLNALREWVLAQPHLRSRTSDQFLIVFLRAAKFSLEKAKRRLEDYYMYRSTMPEIFLNRDLTEPKVYEIYRAGCLLYLLEPVAPDGPRVVMIRPNRFDMKKHTIPDVFRVGAMATDILLYEDDNAIVAGYKLIMDLGKMPKSVIFNFDPAFARKMTIMINKMSPTRMKGFHFLHVPSVFAKLFNLVKSVINVKLRNRFFVHTGNLETLYAHIPRHILPKEYGGQIDIDTLQREWMQKFINNNDFLKEEESYGVVDKIAKSCTQKIAKANNGDAYGVEGSFRKLNLD